MTQSVDPDRYTVVPRTLTFLTRPGEILLLRLPDDHPDWPGRYNGVGGHIEAGEDAATAAAREVREETGLPVRRLNLRGTVFIHTGRRPGIVLFVFTGEAEGPPAAQISAGRLRWVPMEELAGLPLVEDLPSLLSRALPPRPGAPFSAIYRYGDKGTLQASFEGPSGAG